MVIAFNQLNAEVWQKSEIPIPLSLSLLYLKPGCLIGHVFMMFNVIQRSTTFMPYLLITVSNEFAFDHFTVSAIIYCFVICYSVIFIKMFTKIYTDSLMIAIADAICSLDDMNQTFIGFLKVTIDRRLSWDNTYIYYLQIVF